MSFSISLLQIYEKKLNILKFSRHFFGFARLQPPCIRNILAEKIIYKGPCLQNDLYALFFLKPAFYAEKNELFVENGMKKPRKRKARRGLRKICLKRLWYNTISESIPFIRRIYMGILIPFLNLFNVIFNGD